MKYLLVLLVLSSTSFSYGASFKLKPGLWKLETDLHSREGKKSIQDSLPQKEEEEDNALTEMCVTEEESKLASSLVQQGECRFENITETKDELSGDITCTQNRTGKARWKKISEEEFIMTMETTSDSQPVKLTQRGRFVSKDCVKS